MFLKTLTLTNFRNYQELNFSFKEGITVLKGDNAQGKTSFLESVFFLATTKSPKALREDQLVMKGEEVLRVEGELEDGTTLEIVLQLVGEILRKRIKVNGIPRRVIDYSGHLATILFSPEDINLVTGSPSLRRYHIDTTISQIDREYKKTLSRYEQVITRKNKVLKSIREGFAKKDELTFWSDQQILLGGILNIKREELFKFLNNTSKKFGDFKLEYKPNVINVERLEEYYIREVASASSLIGPHRDDFLFKLGERDLAIYGSRGEQRTAVLDLKLAELEYFEVILGTRPLLLLDDIFSELDEEHRSHVVAVAKLQQTIIATVEYDEFIKKLLKETDIFTVNQGVLSKS